jgi:hypothetical protein
LLVATPSPVASEPQTAERRHPRGIPSPGVRHHLPPPVDQPVTLLGVHLPGFRGPIDRMLGRWPGECRKGQHAPTWRKAADDQLAAYTDVPADQKRQAVEPLAVCTSGSLTSGSKDDAAAPKATGRVGAVSPAGQGRSRPCCTDQAGDRCRHVDVPKGGDLSRYRRAQLATIAEMLNERPRKTLAWRSPAEAYAELLAVQ